MWIWQEGEDYDVQVGASGSDRRRAASNRYCLGAGWGSALDHHVEYRFHLPLRYFQASLHLRYVRDKEGDASVQVSLDGKPIGRAISLPPTDGTGERAEEWKIVTISLGDIPAGEHILKLQPASPNSEIAIDGFFIADPAFHLPPDFMRFLQEEERKIEVSTIHLEAKVRFHHVPRQNRRYVIPSFAQVIPELASLPSEMESDAANAQPYVSFGYDGRRKPNYDAETVWHALRRETLDNTDHAGKLGLYNPTTDMNYMIGFQIGARIASYEAPEFALPGVTKAHLPNLLIEEAQIHEGIKATVCFLPCGPNTVIAAVAAENATDDRKEIYIHQMIAKEPIAGRPVRSGVRTGQMRWIGYDNANEVTISCYDEWNRKDSSRPIGQILCTLGGAHKIGGPQGLESAQQSVGYVFINDFGGAVGRLHPIRYQGTKYRVSIPAHSGQIALMAVHLERYASTMVPGPGDGKIYVKRSDDDAMLASVQILIDALELPWLEEIGEQIRKHQESKAATES